MKPYAEYKDSGVEWIGKIPSGWNINKVSRNTYVKGRIGWKGLKSDEFIDEGPYLVTGTDFRCGKIDWENAYHISPERYYEDPYIILKEGDVLITKDGTIGKIALVDFLPSQATLNSGIFVTRPINDSYYSLFFYWILISNVFKSFFDYESQGSTVKHLYQNVFEDFKFPLPPVSEQHQIVAFLDHKTQLIDDLIEKTEKKIELLKEKRTALINHCVTKGLNPDAEMKDSGVEWIGEIPSHWEIKKLKYFREVFSSSVNRHLHKNEIQVYVCHYPMVYYNEFINENIQMEKGSCREDEYKKYILKKGQVILTKDSESPDDIGIPCYIENDFNNVVCGYHLTIIQKKNKSINSKFLFRFIQSDRVRAYFENNSKGITRFSLGKPIIKNLFINVPTLSEQKQIVEHLDEQTQNIDSTIEKETQRIELLKEYRQSLISAAVTGKIDVRDWNK